jgi:hypothetical protein
MLSLARLYSNLSELLAAHWNDVRWPTRSAGSRKSDEPWVYGWETDVCAETIRVFIVLIASSTGRPLMDHVLDLLPPTSLRSEGN